MSTSYSLKWNLFHYIPVIGTIKILITTMHFSGIILVISEINKTNYYEHK